MNNLPYAVTTAAFTQPAVGSTVSVVVTATGAMSSNQVIFVDSGGCYTVSSITDSTHVVLTNLGSPGNASPTTSVPAASQVSPMSPSDVAGVLPAANQQPQTMTGDVIGTTDSNVLATVNANVGSFGDATHVAQVTVNAKGLVTAASSVAISASASGCYVKTTLLTASSGNFTTSSTTNTIKIRGVAGGGAGGGSSTATFTAGSGGGSGSYAEATFSVSSNTAYAYTCGAAGAGSSGSNGGSGGNSTFVVGGTTVTCHAGTGGVKSSSSIAIGSVGGAVSSNGYLNVAGQNGGAGFAFSAGSYAQYSGAGGSSLLGLGGGGVAATDGNGNSGSGYGAGGGGSLSIGSTAYTGGGGTQGCWIVDEYT